MIEVFIKTHCIRHVAIVISYLEVYFWKNGFLKFSLTEYCNNLASLNYTWNSTYSVCYRYHTEVLLPDQCKEACQSEDSRSRVMLLDSDEMFNFTTAITSK